jgi:hypothetical protein
MTLPRLLSAAAPLTALFALAAVGAARAETVAYWRFEDGAPGTSVFAQPGFLTADTSGNGNFMRTFNATTTPLFSNVVPAGTVAQTNAANTGALRFFDRVGGGTTDLYTAAGGETPNGLPEPAINNLTFGQFTIEASVRFDDLNGFQTFLGKDGSGYPNSDAPLASLYFQLVQDAGNERKIAIKTHQSDGAFVSAYSLSAVQTDTWYNLAAVMDGASLSLYLATPGNPYVLQQSVAFTGPMALQNRVWTMGRGLFNEQIGDQFRGYLDEVRISNAALAPSQFVFSAPAVTTVPEADTPSLLALPAAALALSLVSRHRRRG